MPSVPTCLSTPLRLSTVNIFLLPKEGSCSPPAPGWHPPPAATPRAPGGHQVPAAAPPASFCFYLFINSTSPASERAVYNNVSRNIFSLKSPFKKWRRGGSDFFFLPFFFLNTEKLLFLPKCFARRVTAGGEAGRRLAAGFHWWGIRLSAGLEQSWGLGEAGTPVGVGTGLFCTPFFKKTTDSALNTSAQLVFFGFQFLWAKVSL